MAVHAACDAVFGRLLFGDWDLFPAAVDQCHPIASLGEPNRIPPGAPAGVEHPT